MKQTIPLLTISLAGIMTSSGALTYFDAPAAGSTVGDLSFASTAGGWTERTDGPAANAFATTAQQGTGGAGASVSATLSIANLAPSSTYTDVRIYYIGKAQTDAANNWDFDYSYNGGSGSVLDEVDGTNVDTSMSGIGAPATITGDIRYMIEVADFTTDGSGGIDFVFTRPDLNRDGVTQRTARFVIDGIAYNTVAIPEPGSMLLSALAGVFLLRRRR